MVSLGRGDFRFPSPLDTILRGFPCGNSWRSLLLLEATDKPLEKALIVCLKWISSPTDHLLVSGLCLLRMPGAPRPVGLRGASQINQPDQRPLLSLTWHLLVSTWWTATGVQTRNEVKGFQKQAHSPSLSLSYHHRESPRSRDSLAQRVEEGQKASYSSNCHEIKEVVTFHLQMVQPPHHLDGSNPPRLSGSLCPLPWCNSEPLDRA